MRAFKLMLIAALVLGLGSMAYAELQNVEVNGQIRIRGNWYDYGDSLGGETTFVEQRTRLGVCADFTDEVKAVIELDSYDVWGTDFRSNYITGFDGPGAGADINLYQSYIQASEMWGTPLRLRVGRQEISLGSEWLVGVNNASSLFWGLSFDGIRLTYETDMFSVDAIATKLGESFDGFSDGDVDFYTLYGSYKGFEDIVLDAYWMYVHDHEFLTPYDVKLHTIGLRGAGTVGAFDFEAEAAYQFGEAELELLFGDADLDYDALGLNLEVGYTFDMNWQPRVFLGGAYLDGGDTGRQGFFFNDTPELAFNRLFSNWEYSEFLANTDESNLIIYRAGVGAMPTENIELLLSLAYFQVDEEVDTPWWWFWDDADDDLGFEVGLYADYHYTEDLTFRAGYAHFFTDDGIGDGNAWNGNGLIAFAGDDDDDYDYLFIETEIKF
ncbi:MAG: alginate export family protein [Candidatus Hydrogenedentes bacterium]|nr:alginate export family protein [Candidatus Hydrogenedentota bacterium]MBI3117200.1 alginate export family protein [Candidatus Hydrogenedentota bacterium]